MIFNFHSDLTDLINFISVLAEINDDIYLVHDKRGLAGARRLAQAEEVEFVDITNQKLLTPGNP